MSTRALLCVCALGVAAVLSAPASAQTITPWQILFDDPAMEPPDTLAGWHGQTARWQAPSPTDVRWQPAAEPSLDKPALAPHALRLHATPILRGVALTHLQTVFVTPHVGPEELAIVLEGVPGPAWLTITNGAYPDGLVLVSEALGPQLAAWTHADIADVLVPDEPNRLVVSHMNSCCFEAKLGKVSVLVAGLPILEIENLPPVAIAGDVTVEAGPGCRAEASVDAGSFDAADEPLTLWQDPFFRSGYPLGETAVTLTVCDPLRLCGVDDAIVSVVDTTPPAVACGHEATLPEDDVPARIVARAADACGAEASVVDWRCARIGLGSAGGLVIEEHDGCSAYATRDGLLIEDAGVAGELFFWTIRGVDPSGNEAEATCGLLVTDRLREASPL